MGCFGKIISISILIFAIIGFRSLGGMDFVKELIDDIKISQQKTTDISQRNFTITKNALDDYSVEKSKNFLGFKLTEIEYQKAPQKIIIIDSKGLIKFDKKDFYSTEINNTLKRIVNKFAYQAVRIENLKIINNGDFEAMGQKIPYVIFEADVVRGKNPKIRGMLGIAENPKGKVDLILSYVTLGKYDQKITEYFLKQINYRK